MTNPIIMQKNTAAIFQEKTFRKIFFKVIHLHPIFMYMESHKTIDAFSVFFVYNFESHKLILIIHAHCFFAIVYYHRWENI